MATLVLLNGPPASGKSTLAARLVARRPLALNLDIDVIRGLLGNWLDEPAEAGIAARSLAIAMATVHMCAGHDVVIPQFLARSEFIVELEQVADDVGARFVEIALVGDRDVALDAFRSRSRAPESQAHIDAAAIVARSGDADAVAGMFDRYVAMVADRPNAHRIEVIVGDIDATVDLVERALN